MARLPGGLQRPGSLSHGNRENDGRLDGTIVEVDERER